MTACQLSFIEQLILLTESSRSQQRCQWAMAKILIYFFEVEKSHFRSKKNIFRSYSVIRNLKKSGNQGISGKLASLSQGQIINIKCAKSQ